MTIQWTPWHSYIIVIFVLLALPVGMWYTMYCMDQEHKKARAKFVKDLNKICYQCNHDEAQEAMDAVVPR